MPNDIELGWLVGMVEGEGCISLEKDGTRYNPEVHITNTNLLTIERIERILDSLGIKYSRWEGRSKNKVLRRVRVTDMQHMNLFLVIVMPHLFGKRAEARLLKEYLDLRSAKGKEPNGSDEYSIYRLLSQIKRTNDLE